MEVGITDHRILTAEKDFEVNRALQREALQLPTLRSETWYNRQ
jgi:hypothetical protein